MTATSQIPPRHATAAFAPTSRSQSACGLRYRLDRRRRPDGLHVVWLFVDLTIATPSSAGKNNVDIRRAPYLFFFRLTFRHFTANDAMQMLYCCWYRPHSIRSRVYETVPCPSACPAVCLSQHESTAAKLSLQVCCCRLGGQDISTDCCSRGGRRANAGSATLSACVCS